MKKTVAIIPARGGSKGIPNKNIIDFCGKPLLAWSIEQAKAVPGIASVWVTSDSDLILATASQFGARTIARPAWTPELRYACRRPPAVASRPLVRGSDIAKITILSPSY